jgi:hypothetical protein
MKKIILFSFFILLSFSFLNNANSVWYWNHWVVFSNPWATALWTVNWWWPNRWTLCNSDWDTTWWSPSFPYTGTMDYAVAQNNSSVSLTPHSDSELSIWSSWTLRCLYWDWASPTWSVSYSTTAWTNSDVTVYIACSDTWWSWCKMSAISWWTISWNTYYRTFSSNTSWSITLDDIAWNPWINVSYNVWNIDKTPPSTSDISSSPADWTYLLANNSKNITITWNASWWSPITYIEWKFEDINNPSSTITYITASDILSENVNISIVDNNIEVGNYRDYTYYITNVCDAASNCTSNIKNFVYHVYAWNISNITSNLVWVSSFDNGGVADWTDNLLTVNFRDAYLNKIVQVKNALNVVIRDVTLKISYNNTLHLDQLNNFWTDSAVTADVFTPTIWSSSTNLMNYVNGIYNINFKIFAPTYLVWVTDWRNFAKWNFTISNIEWIVSDFSGSIPLGWPIDFQFKPIYYTNITWELNPTGLWFVEWRVQSGSIDINQNGLVTPNFGLDDWLFFVQTWTKKDYFTSTWRIMPYPKQNIIISDILKWTKFLSSFNLSINYIFETLFTLVDNPTAYLDDIKDVRLNQYIKYTLDSYNITYLAWILNNNNTQNFETLKIYWITNIDKNKQKDLIANQWSNNIQNLAWKINKASLKEYIRKNAISVVKFINSIDNSLSILDLSWVNWNNTNNWWKTLWNILYYGNLNWTNVELWNWTQLPITWKKTIVVVWW